jgi:hypothetical protein
MDKIVLIQNNGYFNKLWITPMMEKLANQFKDFEQFRFTVSLVPAGYDATWEESCKGPFGYIGPPSSFEKLNFPEELETIVCTCKLKPEFNSDKEEVQNLSNDIYIREGGRNNKFVSMTIEKIYSYQKIDKQFYIHRNFGFDGIYEQLKLLNPNLLEEDLITTELGNTIKCLHGEFYNSSFVHITEDEKGSCLKSFTRSYNEITGVNHYDFSLTIISTDIGTNMDVIVKILNIISKHLI